MSEYEIKRWDVVSFGPSITKVPMIYIKPDPAFLEFVRENNYAVMCDIQGTGMIYDGKPIPGVVYKSSEIPNCRPNYFAQTGDYVITLLGTWNGYPSPDRLGKVIIKGLKGAISEDQIVSPAEAQKAMRALKSGKKIKPVPVALAIAGVLLILLVLFLIAKFVTKK